MVCISLHSRVRWAAVILSFLRVSLFLRDERVGPFHYSTVHVLIFERHGVGEASLRFTKYQRS